jgi:hypothetical protein
MSVWYVLLINIIRAVVFGMKRQTAFACLFVCCLFGLQYMFIGGGSMTRLSGSRSVRFVFIRSNQHAKYRIHL